MSLDMSCVSREMVKGNGHQLVSLACQTSEYDIFGKNESSC